jgi:acyl carrier protein
MDVNYFIKELSNILETSIEEISMDDVLDKFESWDSLAMMSFVILFRDQTKKEIDPMKVLKCSTVSNLFDLIK